MIRGIFESVRIFRMVQRALSLAVILAFLIYFIGIFNMFTLEELTLPASIIYICGGGAIVTIVYTVIKICWTSFKVTDFFTIYSIRTAQRVTFSDGLFIEKGSRIFELHFGDKRSFKKLRKHTGSNERIKYLSVKKEMIIGILKVVEAVKENQYGLNERVVFKASSHLLNRYDQELGGKVANERDKEPIIAYILSIFTVRRMEKLAESQKGEELGMIERFKEDWKRLIKGRITRYIPASELMEKEEYYRERLARVEKFLATENKKAELRGRKDKVKM